MFACFVSIISASFQLGPLSHRSDRNQFFFSTFCGIKSIAMVASRIVELANRIAANTNKVNDYLVAHNLPTPSFDLNGAQDTLIPKNELDVELARVAIIDDTLELRRLALGPREYLMSYTVSPP
jgi:hypothetical protein